MVACQRILQGQTRAIRATTEEAYGRKVGPNNVAWPPLAKRCELLIEMFHVKMTGATPRQDAVGAKRNGVALNVAETAMFKNPASTTAPVTGGRRARRSKTTWEKGIFFGKTYGSDECTSVGLHSVRTVQRLPEEDQAHLPRDL